MTISTRLSGNSHVRTDRGNRQLGFVTTSSKAAKKFTNKETNEFANKTKHNVSWRDAKNFLREAETEGAYVRMALGQSGGGHRKMLMSPSIFVLHAAEAMTAVLFVVQLTVAKRFRRHGFLPAEQSTNSRRGWLF